MIWNDWLGYGRFVMYDLVTEGFLFSGFLRMVFHLLVCYG